MSTPRGALKHGARQASKALARGMEAERVAPGDGQAVGGVYDLFISGPIPVELARFTATAEGEDVTLTWQTASETGNAGFAVDQRVAGGGRAEVGFVAGASTATEAQSYAFRVEHVGYGPHAFRLHQVDLDGTATPSDVREVTVRLAAPYAVAAYPNPSVEAARIDVTT